MAYEQKGWNGKAIEHYDKFLDLWKDVDPGMAEVEDARKRVAGLESQQFFSYFIKMKSITSVKELMN